MNRIQRRNVSDGGEGETASIDRLSDLPDAILCHILSHLSTKTSIRTSILARRWRFVWKYVPNLHFYRENQDFINRVLVLHTLPSINTLRIYWGDDTCSGFQMETWIIAAVARNVRNLGISRYFKMKFQLPLQLLTCETLVDLELKCCCIIPMAKTVWLPRLKYLSLSVVKFEAEESLPRLLSGCPVLEDLLLRLVIEADDLVICKISSPTLQTLEVDLKHGRRPYLREYRLKIDTPALEYLKINDGLSEHIESGMMTSLTEADICVYNNRPKGDNYVYSQSVLQFLNRLCNVKRLRLDLSDSNMILDSAATVRFHNLRELMLAAEGIFLSKFLANADNLENLKFTEVCEEGRITWVEPEQVPTCLSSHLRFIELIDILEWSNFEIVRYLLRNARILERIELYPEDFESKKWSIEEVSQIERGSEACEIKVHGY